VLLEPRDALRYGRRFCAELASGLPLRAQTLNEKNEPLESFGFGQVALGRPFNRDDVKSKWADRSKTQNWRVERSGYNVVTSTPADTGWIVTSQPPGFRKVMEARRSIGGRTGSVSQIVLSDGLSAVSIFIEPSLREPKGPSLWQQGAVNIYTRQQGNHTVTVLGEAPAGTLMQIANSLEQKPTTASLQ
jgi:sigma-E factor negative regulatory protein RseB